MESADFIETATALVCVELHRNLDIVQTNSQDINHMALAWSEKKLDVFCQRDPTKSNTINELISLQKYVWGGGVVEGGMLYKFVYIIVRTFLNMIFSMWTVTQIFMLYCIGSIHLDFPHHHDI